MKFHVCVCFVVVGVTLSEATLYCLLRLQQHSIVSQRMMNHQTSKRLHMLLGLSSFLLMPCRDDDDSIPTLDTDMIAAVFKIPEQPEDVLPPARLLDRVLFEGCSYFEPICVVLVLQTAGCRQAQWLVIVDLYQGIDDR